MHIFSGISRGLLSLRAVGWLPCAAPLVMAAIPVAAPAQGPEYEWRSGFHVAGAGPNILVAPLLVLRQTTVNSSVIFDDGTGPALYIGGFFGAIGDVPASNVAKYLGGSEWKGLGPVDVDSYVVELDVMPTAGGDVLIRHRRERLYPNLSSVERWDGGAWVDMSDGLPADVLFNDLAVLTEPGPARRLYIGGGSEFAPGRLFRYDGGTWEEVTSTGLELPVTKLFDYVHPDGTSQAIAGTGYAGSPVTRGKLYITSNPAAKEPWTPIGDDLNMIPRGIVVAGSTEEPDIYVGGFATFAAPTGVRVLHNLKGSWEPVGSPALPGNVNDLRLLDLGDGPRLVAAGEFFMQGGRNLAVLEQETWTPLISSVDWDSSNSSRILTINQPPQPPQPAGSLDLFIGGEFSSIETTVTSAMAFLRNGYWAAPTLRGNGIIGDCNALEVFQRPSVDPSLRLFAGGSQITAGVTPWPNIFAWDNSSWTPTGDRDVNNAMELSVVDEAGGPAIYAGGYFGFTPQFQTVVVTRWNGTEWVPVGASGSAPFTSRVMSLIGFDGALFAGGEIYSMNNQFISGGVARYLDGEWSNTNNGPGIVRAFVVFDSNLYAAGSSTLALYDADTNSWTTVASTDGWIEAMELFDDGSGTRLYVGGSFAEIDGVSASNVASYDGKSWSAAGPGVDGVVHALHVFDDGVAPMLIAGGRFMHAGEVSAEAIARWDGATWSAVDAQGGIDGVVYELESFPDEHGPALYAGGAFTQAGAHVSVNLAKYGRIGPVCPSDWNHDNVFNSQDLFDFLADFFTGNADFNKDGSTDSTDTVEFFDAFLTGC